MAWAEGRGAGLVGLNPLHAPTPSADPPDSPYSPSTRRWHDPLLIALDDVPGFSDLPDATERRAAGQDHREAQRHADAMRRHRDALVAELAELDHTQNDLLDRLVASAT